VLKAEDDLAEAVVLAQQAWGFWEEMSDWTRTEAVRQDIVSWLTQIAETVLHSTNTDASQDAEQLLSRLRQAVSMPDTR